MTLLSVPMTAQAAMVGTQAVIASEQLSFSRAQLAATLDRADVQRQLTSLGVDVQQAKERVAAMSEEEIAATNGKVEQLPAGGDALGWIVLVFLVLLVTDIAGYTDIFPFVNKN
jgi:hypothetical protein